MDEDVLASDVDRDGPLLPSSQSTRWWTDEEDRRVARKVDWLIIPIMFCCYTFSILDRNNLGNVRAELSASLALTDAQWVWLLMIFHIFYVAFHSLLLLVAVIPPSKFIALNLLCWALASMAQSAAQSWGFLMVCRALLGIFESAFSTGAAYYFSLVFPRHEVGLRFAIFMAAGPFAGTWSGLAAWLILRFENPMMENWRLVFFIESLMTLLFVPIVWLRLPDSVATARGLSPRERKIAVARLSKQKTPATDGIALVRTTESGENDASISRRSSHRNRLVLSSGLEALKDVMSWFTAILFFSKNIALSSLAIFLPTILQGLGFSSLQSQIYTVPPFACGVIFSLLAAFAGDRLQIRGLLGAAMATLAAIGYGVLATATGQPIRYAACFLVTTGLFAFAPLLYFWLVCNSHDHSQRGVSLVILGSIGHLGPFLGMSLFPKAEGPRYQHGMFVCAAFLLFAALLCIFGSAVMFTSNARRRRARVRYDHHSMTREERERDLASRGRRSPFFLWEL